MDTGESLPHSNLQSRQWALEQLGISSFVDADGKEQLSIRLGSSSSEKPQFSEAVLDKSTGQWIPRTPQPALQKAELAHRPSRHSLKAEPDTKCWTSHLPQNENVDWFLTGVDWDTTDFGPLESWPISLRTVVSIVLADNSPAVVYWGPSFSACFNLTAYNDVCQRLNNRSGIQGMPFKDIWEQSWSTLESFFRAMQDSSRTMKSMEVTLFPQQPDGRLEETFWSGTLLPILDERGKVNGFYNRATEITSEKVRERRSKMLYSISAPPADPNGSVWEHLFQALRENPEDFPMAFAYSAEDDAASCKLTLQQSLGLPPGGHPLVPKYVDIYEGSTGFLFYYRRLKATNKPIVLHHLDNTLPENFLEGFDWRGYGDTPISMALVPVSVSSRLLGVVVFGLNPRRHYQIEDEAFIQSLCRQASATIAFAVDREEAHERAERLTLQLQESERQIREIAEHSPVGMIRLTPAGNIIWANKQYYEMTGHPVEDKYEFSFVEPLHPDEKERMMGMWRELVNELRHVSQEFRLQRTWRPPATAGNPYPKEESCWLMAHAFPALEDGKVKSIVCCITDISKTKWTEEVQSRLALEATEARKLQEAFIDFVSHEMRNPLSAITQLADGIAASLVDWTSSDQSPEATQQLLKENVEYAKTILLCASHQKRIVDDVLTLSKLDSQLLSITPVVTQPHVVVESALTMFRAEFATHSIAVESVADDTFEQYKVDWVSVDPVRLTQIFINLLTNAIKFTKLEAVRKITIRRSVFIGHVPRIDNIVWFPTKKPKRLPPQSPQRGDGEPVNLLFSVSDTGKGLEQEEMARLFHRFQQGTKKTHIKYGGSGLGLFISRELTENMGGEIGVITEPGKGSTFAFYVQARRAVAPNDDVHVVQHSTPSSMSRRTSSTFKAEIPIRASPRITPAKRPASVLLVEDNIINAQVLTKQLERGGCTVYNANHGIEALDFLPRTRSWHDYRPIQKVETPSSNLDVDIDCILMDVEMPVLDGLTCTRRIRELEQKGKLKRHIQIIAITANARAEQIEAAFEAGVDDILPKPFRVMELLEKIENNTKKGKVSVAGE
ncbi:PA domain-containing protein [Cladophialophora immunda]|nr:PA domain-containing protein [Cladophialophora immunda]